MNQRQDKSNLAGACLFVLVLAMVVTPRVALGSDVDRFETTGYSDEGLETLVAPIALYVDDLIAIVLPASAYPLQIVQADRFRSARQADASLTPDPNWDEAVIALLNYPDVLRMMSERIEWTADLGDAFVASQADVLDAVQGFRHRVSAAGNLRSDERVSVRAVNGRIEIVPVDRQVIYVPYYEPTRVVVYQREPQIRYYRARYPLYYYPYGTDYRFESGFFFGVSSAFVIGWDSRVVHVYGHDYVRHPYYGRSYAARYSYRPAPAFSRRSYSTSGDRSDHTWRPATSRHHRATRVDRVTRVVQTPASPRSGWSSSSRNRGEATNGPRSFRDGDVQPEVRRDRRSPVTPGRTVSVPPVHNEQGRERRHDQQRQYVRSPRASAAEPRRDSHAQRSPRDALVAPTAAPSEPRRDSHAQRPPRDAVVAPTAAPSEARRDSRAQRPPRDALVAPTAAPSEPRRDSRAQRSPRDATNAPDARPRESRRNLRSTSGEDRPRAGFVAQRPETPATPAPERRNQERSAREDGIPEIPVLPGAVSGIDCGSTRCLHPGFVPGPD